MLNVKENIKVHNRYDLQVIDSITGKVKQEVSAENAVLDAYWNLFFSSNSTNVSALSLIGLGNGTTPPSSSDTGLTNLTHSMSLSSSNTVQISRSEEYPVSSYTYRITIPAISSYVGTFTEIGMRQSGGGGSTYWSHALFEDSEGQPISIVKTDLDILIITYTVYLRIGTLDSNFTWVHPKLNVVNAVFRNAPGSASTPFYTSKNMLACSCAAIDENGTIMRYDNSYAMGGTNQANFANKTYGITTKRMTVENGNGTYYEGIIIDGLGGAVFPNEELFQTQRIRDISVGVGDGTTTGFNTPLSLFVKDSDTIYIDGVAKTRGVDYTINNASASSGLKFMQPANFTYSKSASFDLYKSAPLILCVSDKAPIKEINRLALYIYYSYGEFSGYRYYYSHIQETKDSSWVEVSPAGNIIVDVSDNGTDWNNLLTLTPRTVSSPSRAYIYDKVFEEPFTVKYIRLTLDVSGSSDRYKNAYDLRYNINSFGDTSGLFYDTTEHQLVFTEAPAEGAAITMDASIDRPFKTNQFVIDAAMTLHFGDV